MAQQTMASSSTSELLTTTFCTKFPTDGSKLSMQPLRIRFSRRYCRTPQRLLAARCCNISVK